MFAHPVITEDSPSMAKEGFFKDSADAPLESSTLSDSQQYLASLIEAVSAKIPCNQEAPVNQKHMRSFQKIMETYFRNLETAFPYQKIERIYNRYVEE